MAIDHKDSRKKNAAILASGYTATKRRGEIVCVSLFGVLFIVSVYRLLGTLFFRNIWIFFCASALSMCVADFFSGLAHWAADTWGNLQTPFVGNTFIRSFREHHVEPVAITEHDFIETNGDSMMIALPLLAVTATLDPSSTQDVHELFVATFLVLLALWVSLTNQIHKWSHTYKPSPLVEFLQRAGIVLSKRDHAVHHRQPFDKYYCITNGWLNAPLASIDFWRRLEEIVTTISGATPREDDKFWTAQLVYQSQ